MSKVVAIGLKGPSGPPPIGLRERCPRCDAVIEVMEDEPHIAGVFEIGSKPARAGWLIRCASCAYSRVFIKVPRLKKAE
jgi:hypothetical protein